MAGCWQLARAGPTPPGQLEPVHGWPGFGFGATSEEPSHWKGLDQKNSPVVAELTNSGAGAGLVNVCWIRIGGTCAHCSDMFVSRKMGNKPNAPRTTVLSSLTGCHAKPMRGT